LWQGCGVPPSRFSRPAATVGSLGAAALAGGAGLTAYALWEARRYTLRRFEVPVLPAGASPVRILHLSDIHLVPTQERKLAWLRSLAHLEPDLVVDTGDNLSHRGAVAPLTAALTDVMRRPGAFVLGSNDYFEPRLRNPFRYLMRDDGRRHTNVPQLPWRELVEAFSGAGWLNLTNRPGTLEVAGLRIALAGVDDPHLGYDDLSAVPAAPADADVRIGVAHAPYLRVLDRFADAGYDLILAGHTHGGQVCLPGGRALVTNCDLDTARARGLHRHGAAWLHVSAGLGSSPYLRIRVCCRPEATLLTLVPRQ
jgi:uncharacterized protein